MKLGINIDHIATLRNARGLNNPSILRALEVCQKSKVDTLTVHLREDRRHINDKDVSLLKKNSLIPINLEMALTDEMISIANKIKPKFICLVPEKRNELTTEGGLNLEKISQKKLNLLLSICSKHNIQLSAFINPKIKTVDLAKKLGFSTVELHTGFLDKTKINQKDVLNINKIIKYAYNLNLIVNIGHGLNFNNIKLIKNRDFVDTVHVGHFIISEAIFTSLKSTILKFKGLID
ncbi:MAG: pyridoxine 5'-phosphate synthase [alpha proteobacterium HIMB59]|nr:MAG: pyridoxine 5'-phosphate synthase [alpha proteobacterium HIMB59]